MLLTGSFNRSIDEKLRVAIPKRLRATMELPEGGALFIAPGTDRSLAIYPEESFQRLATRLAEASPTRQDVRAFMRLFYARVQRVELDAQGRIRIPPELAELGGLADATAEPNNPESGKSPGPKATRDVVLLAVHDHLELWSAPHWQRYLEEKQEHYDLMAESALGQPPA